LVKSGDFEGAILVLDKLLVVTPDIDESIYILGFSSYKELASRKTGSQKDSILREAEKLIKQGNELFSIDLRELSVDELPRIIVDINARPPGGLNEFKKRMRSHIESDKCLNELFEGELNFVLITVNEI
jgi:hypothetical protein